LANLNDQELTQILESIKNKDDSSMTELLSLVWDMSAIKDSLRQMNLDVEKLPIGTLKIERIKKAHAILNEIQKHLPV